MRAAKLLTELTAELRERKRAHNSKPYHLLLGAGCAKAAGRPLEAVSSSFANLLQRKPMWATAVGKAEDYASSLPDGLLSRLGPEHRQQLLRSFYSRLPVPLFYQDLASLLKLGYFPEVLTTNFDDLLEQAMVGMGMQPGVDMTVVDLPNYWETYTESESVLGNNGDSSSVPMVVVVKLHGDLARRNAVITAEEVSGLLRRERRIVKEELEADLIVVGYEGESPGLEDYLSQCPGGQLWWISRSHTPPDKLVRTRQLHWIDGDDADVTRIFAEMYHLLERQPALDAVQTIQTYLPGTAKAPEATEDEEQNVDFLRARIRRAQVQLYELEQSLVPGEEDPSLQNQIAYQHRTIAELEDQLRSAPASKSRIAALVSGMRSKMVHVDALPVSVRAYFDRESSTIVDQLQSDKPDQVTVGAALGAVAYIARRASASPELDTELTELMTFVPQALRR